MTNPILAILTPAQAVAVYADQVVRLEARVAAAALATDHGAGGPDGKRYEGKFYHQHVAQLEAARVSLAELTA